MPDKENSYQLQISGFTATGSGVARLDGLAVFIPGALPGETVEAEICRSHKRFAEGRLRKILVPSAARISPQCADYASCGGCMLQHSQYEEQLRIKRDIVRDALQRIGKITVEVPLPLPADEQFGYRNRVCYHVQTVDGQVKLGFYSQSSRKFVPVSQCLLADSRLSAVAMALPELLSAFPQALAVLREIVLRINSSGTAMLLTLVSDSRLKNGRELAAALRERFPQLCSVWECSGPPRYGVYGDKWRLLDGTEYLEDELCGVKLALSPATFTQVNYAQAAALYCLVQDYAALNGSERVVDLYSGAGAIALYVSRFAHSVVGVESYAPAVKNAEHNARLNGIRNCRFICGEAEQVWPELAAQGMSADVVIVDPPRAGCDTALLQTLRDFPVPKIIYVSCDPATLARDLRILSNSGYVIEKLQPVDMFPQTGHVETVVLMSKA